MYSGSQSSQLEFDWHFFINNSLKKSKNENFCERKYCLKLISNNPTFFGMFFPVYYFWNQKSQKEKKKSLNYVLETHIRRLIIVHPWEDNKKKDMDIIDVSISY